ncbi:MAG: hypothetical protein Q9199_003441 [Rusavskia elegans]
MDNLWGRRPGTGNDGGQGPSEIPRRLPQDLPDSKHTDAAHKKKVRAAVEKFLSKRLRHYPETNLEFVRGYIKARDNRQLLSDELDEFRVQIKDRLDKETSATVWTEVLKLYCLDVVERDEADGSLRSTLANALQGQKICLDMDCKKEFKALKGDPKMAPRLVTLLLEALNIASNENDSSDESEG